MTLKTKQTWIRKSISFKSFRKLTSEVRCANHTRFHYKSVLFKEIVAFLNHNFKKTKKVTRLKKFSSWLLTPKNKLRKTIL
jgi:hypothetical protein